jgi:hypothetical protein
MRVDRRIGALLLLIGGVMDLGRLIIFSGFVSVASAEPATIASTEFLPAPAVSVAKAKALRPTRGDL